MYLRRRCLPTIFFLFDFLNGPQTVPAIALTIDNRLAVMANDCYTRVSIGSKLLDGKTLSTLAVHSVSECEDECSRRRDSCYAFSFGVSSKGNGSCAFAPRVPSEPDDFEAHADYDVYVRKYGSPRCESDRLYGNLKIMRDPARRKETPRPMFANGTSSAGYAPRKFLTLPFFRHKDDTTTRDGTSTFVPDADDLARFAHYASGDVVRSAIRGYSDEGGTRWHNDLHRFPSADENVRQLFRPLDLATTGQRQIHDTAAKSLEKSGPPGTEYQFSIQHGSWTQRFRDAAGETGREWNDGSDAIVFGQKTKSVLRDFVLRDFDDGRANADGRVQEGLSSAASTSRGGL